MKPWRFIIAIIVIAVSIGVYLYSSTDIKLYELDIEMPNTQEEMALELYPEVNELSIVMAGDVLLHNTVYQSAYIGNNNYDFKPMFEEIKPIVQAHDLAFYNQESIIGGKSMGLSSYPRFNSPEEIGDAAIDAGFNLVSLANNHTLDKGETGVANSLKYWSDKDVMTAGSYASEEARQEVQIGEVNGITYTLLSYTTITNGLNPSSGKEYLTNIYSEEKAKEDIKRVRDKVDLVFVAMHWGTEYTLKQISSQEKIANFLASQDVDIVIGHHPHVIEPIEYIDDTLVIYSLGNFLADQKTLGLDKRIGAMVSVTFQKTNDKETSILNLTNIETTLTYTHKNSSKEITIYPFDKLDNSILSNYETHYNTYKDVIMDLDNTMKVSTLE